MYFPRICLYNQDLLKRALRALGKSLLVVTGVGYGVVKALDALSTEDDTPVPPETAQNSEPPERNSAKADQIRLDSQLNGIEERLIRLERSIEHASSVVHVTRTELNAAMDQLSSSLDAEIDRRFEVQNRSVQSLRTMMARTDELLEQVIENIESMSIPA